MSKGPPESLADDRGAVVKTPGRFFSRMHKCFSPFRVCVGIRPQRTPSSQPIRERHLFHHELIRSPPQLNPITSELNKTSRQIRSGSLRPAQPQSPLTPHRHPHQLANGVYGHHLCLIIGNHLFRSVQCLNSQFQAIALSPPLTPSQTKPLDQPIRIAILPQNCHRKVPVLHKTAIRLG